MNRHSRYFIEICEINVSQMIDLEDCLILDPPIQIIRIITLKNLQTSMYRSLLSLLTQFRLDITDSVAIAMHMSYKNPCNYYGALVIGISIQKSYFFLYL